MLATMRPYTPALYLPGSIGRYRSYPRNARAVIPGTGYHVGKMRWAEQELNLGPGGRPPTGRYPEVPLRGIGSYSHLGQNAAASRCPTQSTMTGIRKFISTWGAWSDPSCPGYLYVSDPTAGSLSADDALLSLKYQVVGFGALALAAGLGIGAMAFRRRPVSANRRRRRRRSR
jgi:hypothetical protein